MADEDEGKTVKEKIEEKKKKAGPIAYNVYARFFNRVSPWKGFKLTLRRTEQRAEDHESYFENEIKVLELINSWLQIIEPAWLPNAEIMKSKMWAIATRLSFYNFNDPHEGEELALKESFCFRYGTHSFKGFRFETIHFLGKTFTFPVPQPVYFRYANGHFQEVVAFGYQKTSQFHSAGVTPKFSEQESAEEKSSIEKVRTRFKQMLEQEAVKLQAEEARYTKMKVEEIIGTLWQPNPDDPEEKQIEEMLAYIEDAKYSRIMARFVEHIYRVRVQEHKKQLTERGLDQKDAKSALQKYAKKMETLLGDRFRNFNDTLGYLFDPAKKESIPQNEEKWHDHLQEVAALFSDLFKEQDNLKLLSPEYHSELKDYRVVHKHTYWIVKEGVVDKDGNLVIFHPLLENIKVIDRNGLCWAYDISHYGIGRLQMSVDVEKGLFEIYEFDAKGRRHWLVEAYYETYNTSDEKRKYKYRLNYPYLKKYAKEGSPVLYDNFHPLRDGVYPGQDEHGRPLEVVDDKGGFTVFRRDGAEKGKEVGPFPPGTVVPDIYDKYIGNVEDGKPVPPKESTTLRVFPEGFIEPWNYALTMTAMNYEWDAYRDDLRDGRYHPNSVTIMEHIMGQHGDGFPEGVELAEIDSAQQVKERIRSTRGKKILGAAKTPQLKVRWKQLPSSELKKLRYGKYEQEDVEKLRSFEMKLYDPIKSKGKEVGKHTGQRKPGHLNPACDFRAIYNNDFSPRNFFGKRKFNSSAFYQEHIGRRYYYETQTHVDEKYAVMMTDPFVSTRGLAMYIINTVLSGNGHITGVREPDDDIVEAARDLLKKIAKKTKMFDFGPRLYGLPAEVTWTEDPYELKWLKNIEAIKQAKEERNKKHLHGSVHHIQHVYGGLAAGVDSKSFDSPVAYLTAILAKQVKGREKA